MIECKDLCVSFKGKSILKNISLTAESGRITSVIGRNGSGKTTLLSALRGDIKHSGKISVSDADVDTLSIKEISKRISLMPQVLPSPDISVRSLVSFGRTPYTSFSGILSDEDKEKVEHAIDELNISHLADRMLGTLSGGERQRAFFAMLLAQDTDVIMADEPTTYMDIPAKKEMFGFLSDLKSKGKTVIIVLHDINDAIRVSDRIHLIDGGKLIFSGSASEFSSSSYPRDIFALDRIKAEGDDCDCFFY